MVALSETLWSDRLREYAAFVSTSQAQTERARDVAFLLARQPARERFIRHWRQWLRHFQRWAQEPDRYICDPERLDEAIVTLRSYAACANRTAWPELHEILDAITMIADATRADRQYMHDHRLGQRLVASA